MREEALEILFKYLKTDYILKHSYAAEVVMRELAKKLDPITGFITAIAKSYSDKTLLVKKLSLL